jgi:hypothetical protein
MNARNVPRINRVNFALRRGIVVPRTVRFASVTAFPVLFDLYPNYRRYSFFVANDQVVFVDSGHRIVDVVPFEGGAVASSGGGGGAAMAMETDLSPAEIREVQTVLVAEGLPLEVTGVWDVRTRDALISFQRRHGFAANGIIDTRTVAALKLNGKISENHIRSTTRTTTGRGNGREPTGTKSGMQRGQSNGPNAQPQQPRSTSGQGGQGGKGGKAQPNAAQGGNEPKAGNEPKMGNEPKAGNEGGQGAPSRAGQNGTPRSTTGQGGGGMNSTGGQGGSSSTSGQGGGGSKMNRPEPNRSGQPSQNKY